MNANCMGFSRGNDDALNGVVNRVDGRVVDKLIGSGVVVGEVSDEVVFDDGVVCCCSLFFVVW